MHGVTKKTLTLGPISSVTNTVKQYWENIAPPASARSFVATRNENEVDDEHMVVGQVKLLL